MNRLGVVAVGLASALLLTGCGDRAAQPPANGASAASPPPPVGSRGSPFAPVPAVHGRSLTDEQMAAFNRGVGLMGTFAFDEAEKVFAELLASLGENHPFARLARRDLAIARLNQTGEGAQERALELLEPLVAEDPSDITSHYCIGLIRLFLGDPQAATEHFRAAVKVDPKDAYAAYYMGQCLEFAGAADEARTWYARSAELDSSLRSPLLGLQRIESRAGHAEEAARHLELFQSMANNPRAKLAEFKYTRMGHKAEAAVPLVMRDRPPIVGDPFVASTPTIIGEPAWREAEGGEPTSLTAADIDGDGRIDLFAANALADGSSAVLLATESGAWRWVKGHALAAPKGVRAALWGDIDNDGDLDVYLCRAGGNLLFLGDGKGNFADATAASGTGAAGIDTVDGTLADLDHDGDLDLYLANGSGANELFANRGDGRFESIAASSGAAGDGRPSRAAVVNDFDGDRDADILILHATPPHELLLNQRLWKYAPSAAANPLFAERLEGAIAGDWNADGNPSILAAGPQGTLFVATSERGVWSLSRRESAQVGTKEDRSFIAVDAAGGGVPNLLWRKDREIAIAALDGSPIARVAIPPGCGTPRAWTVFQAGVAGPSVAVLTNRCLVTLDPGPGRGSFATLRFSGRTDASQSMRSNASGIGTIYAARVGERWVGGDTYRQGSGHGQSLQPASIGLGQATEVDFLQMEWSDGVFQSELALPAQTTTVVTETQRQISSCPVIFVWDGSGRCFVTDCLGVGGIGYLVAPGEYAPPRPWEHVLLPRDAVPALRNGAFEVTLAEPMEEACYLDAARLVAYDVPTGWSMTVDDRMSMAGPEPTGAARFYRTSVSPTRAFDDRGVDCTAALARADHVAAPVTDIDVHLIGYLRAPHTLTLEFATPLDALPGEPTLVAQGWVEYPYCQTNFAAWQAGISATAPDLEARGADGTWQRVYPAWGYPAGMTREMSLPLRGLPEGATALRLTSNQEIYWDSFLVAGVEACPDARRVELPLVSAALDERGFAVRVPRPQKRADYDGGRSVPLWDTRHQPGFYTAVGACTELLAATDDAVAIFGPGEEITLRFAPRDGSLSAPLSGHERRFMLEVDGWCKDFDLFTGQGETLAPLPTRDGRPIAEDGESAKLHRRFNTRYR